LATQQHVVELQDAQLAGAMDFVAFPLNPQHFYATIERARQHFNLTVERMKRASSAPPSDTQTSRIIAVVSLKGGVGRSTVAANLAIALHQRKSTDVILVEAHQGLGQLPLMLNLRPRHTIANLATETNIDVDLLRGYLQPHQSGIRLLAAPGEPAQVSELAEEVWQHTLPLLSELAPYVVVDTAAAADLALSQVLAHADEILLLTDPTVTGLSNARALLETLHSERERHANIHIVLNRADLDGGLSAATIEKHLGEKIYASIPAEPALATFACNRGVPFVISHPRAQISRQVQQLADQLVKSKAATPNRPPRAVPALLSLFGLLG
jgi:pilus assembly protein CpaE